MKHGRYIYILGDVHGDFGALNKFINREIRQNKAAQSPRGFMKKVDDLQVIILQVGDFAYFWTGYDNTGAIKNHIDWLGGQGGLCPLFWCGGNHEDWDALDALGGRGQRNLGGRGGACTLGGGRQPLVGNVWTFSIGAKVDTGKSGWNGKIDPSMAS